ncbi:hypothetical protein MKW98_014120 [Papaver atlanticum]|uniref:UDP-3-O-acyl-N-acetylglucosamine deacetylase n=1 Tax=Papaver atlanticum TaxID=357466 RepID=A0AAD4SJY6_9MAGN|nr:hypothetical protein MKW98_014120 [Papaver atlanticum]
MNRLKQALGASSSSISWKPTGKLQQTISSKIEKSGKTLHSGDTSTVKLLPALAGEGRYFIYGDTKIPAKIDFTKESPLCTTLSRNGIRVRTVEHLLSALESLNVDNCRIEVTGADEVPLLDGSAKEWVEAVEKTGLSVCKDNNGNTKEKLAPFINEPVHVWKNDSFIAAFPSPKSCISYGINFPQVPAIGCQWVSSVNMDDESFYVKEIASARTFCVYEEVERLREAGLIKGGSAENAIVCSVSEGWLNPPLRFSDEPCRHKVLDLVGDLSLLAEDGNQGFPVGHIVAYKGGHSLHLEFVRRLMGISLEEVSTRC